MSRSFTSWVRHRDRLDDLRPEAEKIIPMIAAAGASGMNLKQLGSAIDLERPVLDGLLVGMVQAGLLVVAHEGGTLVYRTHQRAG